MHSSVPSTKIGMKKRVNLVIHSEISETFINNSGGVLLEKNYDVLAGDLSSEAGLVLVVNSRNQINLSILESLGFDTG